MASKTLGKLKTEMLFNTDLKHLVNVMKNIAATQYQMMERIRTQLDGYGKAVDEMFQLYDFRGSIYPFIRAKNSKTLVCLVTTDFGFLGGLNMKVIQAGMKYAKDDSHYFIIGERGTHYLKELGLSFSSFPGINPDESRYDLLERMTQGIRNAVLKDGYGHVILVYPKSMAFTVQRIEALNLIPCPIFFKDKPKRILLAEEQAQYVILESTNEQVVDELATIWLRKRLMECFESAKLSEFGARTMHLEESFQILSKIEKKLKLEYFKARREKIDQSLRETFTSQLICEN